MLRKFLDAIKQEIENFACHEESEEDLKKSYDAFTRMVREMRDILSLFPD